MKPPVQPSARDEQALLQAARDMRQPEPDATLDAFIVNAAAQHVAQHAAQIRVTHTTPKTRSAFQRLAHWLFGDNQTRGHFKHALAACLVAGIALGLTLQMNRESTSTHYQAITLTDSPPALTPAPSPSAAPSSTAQEEAQKDSASASMSSAPTPPAAPIAPQEMSPPAAPAKSVNKTQREQTRAIVDSAAEAKLEQAQPTAPSRPPPPPPSPAPAPSPITASEPPPAPAMKAEAMPEDRAIYDKHPPAAPSAVAAPPPAPAPQAEEMKSEPMPSQAPRAKMSSPAPETNAQTEIDAQIKRIIDLRRAGKAEDAQRLLRELRARYPNENIDERLREQEKAREKEENKSPALP